MLNLTNLQTKGYDELIEIDGEIVYQVFAIKKNKMNCKIKLNK